MSKKTLYRKKRVRKSKRRRSKRRRSKRRKSKRRRSKRNKSKRRRSKRRRSKKFNVGGVEVNKIEIKTYTLSNIEYDPIKTKIWVDEIFENPKLELNFNDKIEKILIQYITKGIIWVCLLGFPIDWFPPNWKTDYVINYLVKKLKQADDNKRQQLLQPLLSKCSNAYFISEPIFPQGRTYQLLFRYCEIYSDVLDIVYNNAWSNKKVIIVVNNNKYMGHIFLVTYPLVGKGLKIATPWGINKSILETFPGCINTTKGIGKILINTMLDVAKQEDIKYLITWPLPEAVPKLKSMGFILVETNKKNNEVYKFIDNLLKERNAQNLLDANKTFPLLFKEV